jgi:hypothetical protein
MKNAIKTLKSHNEWRRGADTLMGSPTAIGIAIDDCIKAAERYELVRTLNPREFKQIYMENINRGESFDGLVDALIIAKKR